MQDSTYPDKCKMCHRTGFTKSCRDLLDEKICQGRWVHISGKDRTTDKDIDGYGCVDDMVHIVNQSFEFRLIGIQAAVESRGDGMQKELVHQVGALSAEVQRLTQVVAKGILLQKEQHDEAMGSFAPRQLESKVSDDQQLEFEELAQH
jgi:hypothetical protein